MLEKLQKEQIQKLSCIKMLNYEKLGLKSGLEIHQQLDTHKLFCNCPSLIRDDEHNLIVKRRIRPVVGETGKIDVAALYELEKGKEFVYEAYTDTNCEVELDEEPPHKLNQEALDITLQISLLLNAMPVDEIQVMRKTVVDGSNTSGFQRTALTATNGYIETKSGKVTIPTVMLEEDAARKIREDENTITYRLDRLGIPLVEIATGPEIKTPEQAREVASYLGMVLRSTERVKRGIGTIRQDVNLSIKKGARVEIKGVQDLNSIPKVIEKEVERQLELIKQGKKLKEEVRKANPDNTTSFLRPMPGADRLYPETDLKTIKITSERLKKIKLPELLTDKAINLEKKFKINSELARLLVIKKIDFEKFVKKYKNIEPNFIAQTLTLTPENIKGHYNLDTSKIKQKDFEKIFFALNSKKISNDAIEEILIDICKGQKINLNKYKLISNENIEKEIKDLVRSKPGLTIQAYMGIIMQKFQRKISGKEAMEILKKVVK